MGARRSAKDETRRRIVEATMALHLEKGVLATSFEDIARKADVALATVYRHFPTLNELVAGCGAKVMEVIRPPVAEGAPLLFEGASSLDERVRRLVAEFVAFYGRAEKPMVASLRDADRVEGLKHFLDFQRATLEAFVCQALRDALKDAGTGGRTLRVVSALLDFGTWKAMADRGMKPGEVEAVLAELVLCQIERDAAA
jgi:AcrR family transcriptional regulator